VPWTERVPVAPDVLSSDQALLERVCMNDDSAIEELLSGAVWVRHSPTRWALGTRAGREGQGMIAPPMVVKDFSFPSISDAV
jgi:hypothetical protein